VGVDKENMKLGNLFEMETTSELEAFITWKMITERKYNAINNERESVIELMGIRADVWWFVEKMR
jgi:hypothetical protein